MTDVWQWDINKNLYFILNVWICLASHFIKFIKHPLTKHLSPNIYWQNTSSNISLYIIEFISNKHLWSHISNVCKVSSSSERGDILTSLLSIQLRWLYWRRPPMSWVSWLGATYGSNLLVLTYTGCKILFHNNQYTIHVKELKSFF